MIFIALSELVKIFVCEILCTFAPILNWITFFLKTNGLQFKTVLVAVFVPLVSVLDCLRRLETPLDKFQKITKISRVAKSLASSPSFECNP